MRLKYAFVVIMTNRGGIYSKKDQLSGLKFLIKSDPVLMVFPR